MATRDSRCRLRYWTENPSEGTLRQAGGKRQNQLPSQCRGFESADLWLGPPGLAISSGVRCQMAKIEDSKGRWDENSGYTRLLGNARLGQLLSRVQANVMRAGNELEALIENETPTNLTTSLEAILECLRASAMPASPVQVVFKPKMPASSTQWGGRADIALFLHRQRQVLAIELKDGDTFDTKKSSGELESMTKLAAWLQQLTGYHASIHFCSFNQDNRQAIVAGSKGRFTLQQANDRSRTLRTFIYRLHCPAQARTT